MRKTYIFITIAFFNLGCARDIYLNGNDFREYTSAHLKMLIAYQKNGIDYVMDKDTSDAIICPSGGQAWKQEATRKFCEG